MVTLLFSSLLANSMCPNRVDFKFYKVKEGPDKKRHVYNCNYSSDARTAPGESDIEGADAATFKEIQNLITRILAAFYAISSTNAASS